MKTVHGFLAGFFVLMCCARPVAAQSQAPGGGSSRTQSAAQEGEQRMEQMLDTARQAPASRWGFQKQQMVGRLVSRYKELNSGDTAGAAKVSAMIGEALEQARKLSASDYASQKQALASKMAAAMRGGGAGPSAAGVKPVVKTGKLYEGKLFDAHFHLISPRDVMPPQCAAFLRDAGIAGAFLIVPYQPALTNLLTVMERSSPGFFYPSVTVPHDAKGDLMYDEEGLRIMEQNLNNGLMHGLGEIPLRHPVFKRSPGGDWPADGPNQLKLYALAAKYKVPINVHVDYDSAPELDRALSRYPEATVIWAHCGDAPPTLVREMMKQHDNLRADISCRNPYFHRRFSIDQQSLTGGDGTIKADWKALFEEYPDRFMFGSDVGGAADSMSSAGDNEPPRHKQLKEVVQYYRSVLGQLNPATAEKIGWQNAEHLFGVKQKE